MKTLEFGSPGIYYKGAFSWDLRYVTVWLVFSDMNYKRLK